MSTVNINKDSEEMISQLPGFDLDMARKVVEAREKGIVFSSIDELATFLQLKPHIIHKLEDLVSFEHENIINSPNTNKKRSHKARVLDFNVTSNNKQSNENTNNLESAGNQGSIQSDVNEDVFESAGNQGSIQSDVNEDVFESAGNQGSIQSDVNEDVFESAGNQDSVQSNENTVVMTSNSSINIVQANGNTEIIRSNGDHTFRICPKCDAENELGNKFCISCGASLQNVDLNEKPKVKICPNCKEENELDHKFCVYCGVKFNDSNSNGNINDLNKPNSSTSNIDNDHKSRKLDF